ncbi:hypothetical protein F5I97DRAFT_1927431 [Phlebopus sp. FC_14]|nr:hypothetical protein F5I97DRAFT_1927431 [Phlebopus sp. FC_14]
MPSICICGPEDTGNKPYIVVVFGRTGVGVSSLINLIMGYPASGTHPDGKSCTRKIKEHLVNLSDDKRICLYEVPGFGGEVDTEAIMKSIRALEKKKAIDLFVHCLRSQKSTLIPNIVRRIRREIPSVPMVAVVTELERFEGEMEDWWSVISDDGRTANGTALMEKLGLTFNARACVTSLPLIDVALNEKFRKRRMFSEELVKRVITEQCGRAKRTCGDSRT